MKARERTSLDGNWTIATDPDDVGLREGWHGSKGFGRPIAVPGPWQLGGADLVAYTGVAWYHRAFEAQPPDPGQIAVLGFDAVDYACTVWLNGERLGDHEGGYTPFEFVLRPEALVAGRNELVLRVLDPRDNSEIPHGKQGSWYTRVSGPWQPAWLETRPAVHLRALRLTPDPRAGVVHVRLEATVDAEVALAIHDPEGREVASGRCRGEATLAVPAPRLWSPEDPALYVARAQLGDDVLEARFGMRWVERRDGLILLNGEPLYVRGALDQGFWPETVYRPPSLEAIENEIALAKAMGLNLLRKHIKLEDPRYLDACDRLGMLVWEEPACFYKYGERGKARFRREIEAMVARDWNHPSIIAYSLYNEEWGLEWRLWKDAEKQAHVEALYDWARALDPTRLWCDNSGWAHVKTDLNDYHRYFACPEQQREWEADLAHCVERPEQNFVAGRQHHAAGVPVLVSEFGMWGLSEPSRILAYYGGRPWWFDAQWAGHTEEFKSPATAERHFARYGLDRLFGDIDGLARACQARMVEGLKPTIEAMRRRPDLAGYVVTELTDIEWETNGWLDYFRTPKAEPARFAAFNGPIVVMLDLARHVIWDDGRIEGVLAVSNHTGRTLEGRIRWAVEGTPLAGELAVTVPAHFSGPVGRLSAMPPATGRGHARLRLAFALEVDGRVVAENDEQLHVVARALEARPEHVGLPLVDRLDRDLLARLEAGGKALLVAEDGDAIADAGWLSFRRLPPGESWDRASSINFVDPRAFPELALAPLPSLEWEGMFPRWVLPLTSYLHDFGGRQIALEGNQAGLPGERILAGYFEGWLGKLGATIARVPVGAGELTVTTLPLRSQAGRQPIATVMLNRLLAGG